ncbi:MAG: hypothetical protein H0U69_01960 [Trueperaceae bacterium]|nr:hypothetical protein [Trueperaceae bacterium]
MSGICAIIDFGGRTVDVADVDVMASAAPYRSRDARGTWTGAGAALTHLATVATPEAAREHQPIVDAATGSVLIADARIDNRAELVSALGITPRTAAPTDAELILAACATWGRRAAARLVGDFAFVLWDPRRRHLYAARDSMGMRPLFYRLHGRRLWIASEVAQILAAPGVTAALNEPFLMAHLLGAFDEPSWTAYEGISRLDAGCALEVDEASVGAGASPFRTWHVDPGRTVRYRDEREYAEGFREVFSEAVRCRLRSSGQVGLLLSGGLDSGAVASVAGQLLRDGHTDAARFGTYSWAFEDLVEVDERAVSDLIVAHYALASTSIEADALSPLCRYPGGGPTIDDPFAGPYEPLLAHAYARAAADGTRVMLAGNRGDLMVGEGIWDSFGLLLAGRSRDFVRDVRFERDRRGVSALAAARRLVLPPLRSEFGALRPFSALRAAHRRLRPARESPLPPWVRRDAVARAGLAEGRSNTERTPALRGAARRARYRAIFSGMQMAMLLSNERLAARAGFEFADPWSDRRVAEFVLSVPQWAVQRVGEPKRLAREAMRGVMPAEALRAAGKVSPEPLLRRAFTERGTHAVDDLLTGSIAAHMGLVDEGALRAHFTEIREGGP